MAEINSDLLRFSAWSIKDLITRKLSENTAFTDQIYEGSNLAVLIDLFSYMAQCMLQCLNNTASESMFSDTRYYENMNRLVKLIGYNPKGFMPASAEFNIIQTADIENSTDDFIIPRYSAINTGKVDDTGHPIYYSFRNDLILSENDTDNNREDTNSAVTYTVRLYNGIWQMYSTIFTASGNEYETFVLTGLKSDSDSGIYVAHGFIDVYVERDGSMLQYRGLTDEIFMNSTTKYEDGGIEIFSNSEKDRYFSIRLGEDKTYEIKFGNNCNGQSLKEGDRIYVFYMTANGSGDMLTIGEVNTRMIPCTQIAGLTIPMLRKIMLGSLESNNSFESKSENQQQEFITDSIGNMSNYMVVNSSVSTASAKEESVDEIRENAPNYFKLGNRLITKDDYEYYIKNRFKNDIIDVKAQNNWEYINTFFGWLYNLGNNGNLIDFGIRSGKDPKYYISESKLFKHDYAFSDPADSNNVYLWVKMQNQSDILKKTMSEDMLLIKDMTHEPIFLNPITMYFDVCAAPLGRCIQYFREMNAFDPEFESYIEITISDSALYANSQIKTQVNNIILKYFKDMNLRLGQTINTGDIVSDISGIPGVERVRTVFNSKDPEKYPDQIIDGLSFATWSGSIIDRGDDIVVSNASRQLECFQFPTLNTKQLFNKIKVIKRSFSSSNTIQY